MADDASPDYDEIPDPLLGHQVLGRLTLPRPLSVQVEDAAHRRGITPLQMVREIVAEWAIRRMHA